MSDGSNESVSLESMQQLAEKDPVWKEVLAEEDNIPHIKLFNFMGRLTDARVFTADLLGMHSANKDTLLARMMRGVPKMLSNPKIWKHGPTDKNPIDTKAFLYSEMEKSSRAKIDKYRLWIINQALVNYCTILDTALENLLDAIFRKNINALYGASEAKSIDFKRLVALGSVEAVADDLRKKVIRKFTFDDITQRFQFLKSNLGIEVDSVFNWENQEDSITEALKGRALKELQGVYNQRHSVVHQDASPLNSEDELNLISDFLSHTYYNLTSLVMNKLDLTVDIVMFATRQQRYDSIKTRKT